MTKVYITGGDITQIEADALITAINPGGLWWGGIDAAIRRSADDMFHTQAAALMPLHDGQIIYAPKQGTQQGRFDAVIFIVDELATRLDELVTAALHAAAERGLKSVTIPTIRTGVMAGIYETREQALLNLATAVSQFAATHPSKLDEITMVVFGNENDKVFLQKTFFEVRQS